MFVDHESVRSELTAALQTEGFLTVAAAADRWPEVVSAEPEGAAAVILLQRSTVDRSMATIHELRSDPRARELPVIVIAEEGDGSSDSVGRAFRTGADDVLRQPFQVSELTARIGAQLRVRRFVDALSDEKNDAQVMLELTQALASALDFRDILYTVVRRIAEVVQVARASIVLAPEPNQSEIGYVVVASDDQELSNLRINLTKYPEIQQVLRTRQPLTIPDAATHPILDEVRESMDSFQLSALNLFPIVWEDQAIGALFLRSHAHRGDLSGRENHLCQIIANATAVALRNARVMQSLRDHTQQITFARFEAERRLRELRRYADLFASSAEGIAVMDQDGRLLFANPRAYAIVGGHTEAMEGARVTEFLHEEDLPRARTLWSGFLRGEYPRGVDLRVRRGEGDYIVAHCSFADLTDGEGAVLVSFQDVTEQRRTEAEFVKTMEFLESLIDASVDGIVAADMDGNVILFNQGAERIYGYRADEVVGRMRSADLFPGDGASDVLRRIHSERWGGIGRLEPTNMHALGRSQELIPIRLSAAMIYERGEPVATFGIFTDLRDQLRVQERLAEAQEKLAVSEKQALIAELAGTAAHELNQPLTSVMAYAELLKRKLDPESSEYRAAQVMVSEAERMAEIVRKIGKMTKYETKSYVGGQKIIDLDKSSEGQDTTVAGERELGGG